MPARAGAAEIKKTIGSMARASTVSGGKFLKGCCKGGIFAELRTFLQANLPVP
jgi:hypothetical protein